MQKLFFLLLLGTALFTYSCGNDDDGVNNANCNAAIYSQTVGDAATAYVDAVNTWSLDMSAANCTALRNAADAYLDAIDDFDGCTGIDQAQYQMDLAAARQAVDDLTC